MKRRKYTLEILWSNGVLTETKITERQKNLIEKYGELFIVAKYELKGEPEARPVSYQIWDEEDNPLIPVDTQPKTGESASA